MIWLLRDVAGRRWPVMNDGSSGKRAIYTVFPLIHPGGTGTGDLTPALRKAFDAYQVRHGRGPAGLVVNAELVDRAREALNALDLAALQVTSSGGCLAWEVWLMEETS
jgi:hypothetical protein